MQLMHVFDVRIGIEGEREREIGRERERERDRDIGMAWLGMPWMPYGGHAMPWPRSRPLPNGHCPAQMADL